MKVGRSGMINERPCFVLYKEKLDKNIATLIEIERLSAVQILYSLKSFNEVSVLPIIASNLSGMSVSSCSEIEMAANASVKKMHLYAPAYKKEKLLSMIDKVETISFNSLSQWEMFSNLNADVSKGLRINPKLHLPIPSYCNPNLSYSRLGVDYEKFLMAYQEDKGTFSALEGLHFHALFQSSADGVQILFDHLLEHYQELLPTLKWLNLGGGHNFTDKDYNVDAFVKMIAQFKQSYPNIELYFEPGESVLKGCGDFVTTVLDIIPSDDREIVILDTSIETHLLDVAIVNQRLTVKGTNSSSTPYFYELAGNSCLQGDIIGEYFFEEKLEIGDEVIFEDMLPYTMVKMTEFNGMERASFKII